MGNGARSRCGIAKVADVMALPDQESLLLLLGSEVAAVKVSRFLAEFGYSVSLQTVARHRRRECSCRE